MPDFIPTGLIGTSPELCTIRMTIDIYDTPNILDVGKIEDYLPMEMNVDEVSKMRDKSRIGINMGDRVWYHTPTDILDYTRGLYSLSMAKQGEDSLFVKDKETNSIKELSEKQVRATVKPISVMRSDKEVIMGVEVSLTQDISNRFEDMISRHILKEGTVEERFPQRTLSDDGMSIIFESKLQREYNPEKISSILDKLIEDFPVRNIMLTCKVE